MPRHTSPSSGALGDYISLFSTTTTPSRSQSRATSPARRWSSISATRNAQIQFDVDSKTTQNPTINYADVGRLATLVHEMELLRKLVDSLIVDSHVNPTAKAMFPQWSTPMTTSAPPSGWHARARTPSSRPGTSRAGGRTNSWALTRTGSRVIPPARPELARSRSSMDRWQVGCRGSRNGPDPSNLV